MALPAASPTPLYRWKTFESYEVRVLRDNQDTLVQLYNKAAAQIEKTARYSNDADLPGSKRCIRKWTRGKQELRLFLTSEPSTINFFQVNLSSKTLSTYTFRNRTEETLAMIRSCKHPVFIDGDKTLSFSEGSQPVTPAEKWKISEDDDCELGLIRIGADGSEEELIHHSPKQGLRGLEDVRVIRKKQGDREDLICQVFHRATGLVRTISLVESIPDAPIEKRIENILSGQLIDMTYCINNLPQTVTFREESEPILFAEGKNLNTLPISEIEQTMIEYLTYRDANGREVSCYDAKTFLVKKLMRDTYIGRKPVIYVHLERNRFVTTLKPILSFIESLLNTGNAKSYVGSIREPAMADLILRNSELSSDPKRKQQAIEGFQMTFARCGTVDIYIACDRTWGCLTCDDQTWTMTSASWGRGVRSVPGRIRNWIMQNREPPPLEQTLPYERMGTANIQEVVED